MAGLERLAALLLVLSPSVSALAAPNGAPQHPRQASSAEDEPEPDRSLVRARVDLSPIGFVSGAPVTERSFSQFGLGATYTRLDAGGRLTDPPALDEHDVGAVFGETGVHYRSLGNTSARMRNSAHLGGGSAGLEGDLSLDFSVGYRLSLAPQHGPFVRLRLRGELLGNQSFYWSELTLPGFNAGYQWLEDDSQVELYAFGGLVLVGRYNLVGIAYRDLGGSQELGAGVALGLDRFQIDIDYRVISDGRHPPQGALGVLSGLSCLQVGQPIVCLELRVFDGDTQARGGAGRFDTVVGYGGLRVGYGPVRPASPPRGE